MKEALSRFAVLIGAAVMVACSSTVTGGGEGSGGSTIGTGGAGTCAPPPPVGSIDPNDCGGSATSTTGGGTSCEYFCYDGAQHTYGAECDGTECKCKYDNEVLCTCASSDTSCLQSCCPDPYPHYDPNGSGGFGSGQTSAVASSGSG